MTRSVKLEAPMRTLVTVLRNLRSPCAVLVTGVASLTTVHAQTAPAPEAVSAPAPATAPVATPQSPLVAQAAPQTAPAAVPAKPAAAAVPETEEITVTATRRAELISKVPLSVSAYTQENLDMKGVKDFTDLVRFTPGVTIDTDGTNNISIRGIASSAGAGTTGIYIDDTPIQVRALSYYANDALPEAFDLERVEILRGPQGTLFGAGAEGGAVRYIMAQPNMQAPSTYARTELSFTEGGAPSYESGIAYGAPIIEDELGYRASIWFRHDGGWIDQENPMTHDITSTNANFSNDLALRFALKWNVNDNLTIAPSMIYQQRNANTDTAYWDSFSTPSNNVYRNGDPDLIPEPDHYFLPALKVEADLGSATLISNTSYYTRYDLSGYDGTIYNLSYFQTFNSDSSPIYNPGYAPLNPGLYPLINANGVYLPASIQDYRAVATATNEQRSITEELRLQSNDSRAPLVWTAGVFFSISKQSSLEAINDPQLGSLFATIFQPPYNNYINYFGAPLLSNGDSYASYAYSEDRQLALFGEATYAVTDQLKATVGARISRTDLGYAAQGNGPENFGITGGTGYEHETPISPKASLAYQADPNDMYYATYAKGFRIGGANAPVPYAACATDLSNLGLTQVPESYNSDTVDSFELGAKNKVGDLRVASSLYYIQWQGIQQNIYLPDCGFQYTANFGNAVAKGGDVQLEYSPNRAWDFDMSMGYTDARYVTNASTSGHIIAMAGDAIEGATVTPAPRLTFALGAQYNFAWDQRKSFFRVDYEFQDRTDVPTASEDPRASGTYDPLAYTPRSYGYVSVRAGTMFGHWNVSAFIDNLFNAHPELPPSAYEHTEVDPYNANPPSVVMRAFTLRPLTVGVTASIRM